ncbi:Ref family recombination enhancement nuclease [Pseudoxanthomonas sp.]|uniref:Ref family recombination enhancement nuclease n=1 Tax=Pseudoxanthomonas sp. TaxID=1871049 RepID=UPI00260ADEF4|nr:Ref family recombination enhancement nuclease [Pseudoxanthomonas sp.]WDS36223.1 MAG: Ref family recombination enhancement nuclease [Pseudoxanthomonas sp.]
MSRRGKAPTLAEGRRIAECKEGVCIPCLIWKESGKAPANFWPQIGGDYHHTKSGNIRRGHRFGFCNCGWHHRGLLDFACTHDEMRQHYGPSLMDGSRLFHETYGSDDELIARQDSLIGWRDAA